MAFTMRTTKPEKGNKYYITQAKGGYSRAIQGSPTDPDCNVLSNCVGYAYGRFNEIGGYGCCKYLAPVNAENFMQYAGSCKTGMTPKLGACMVWQKGATLSGSDGAGHVAIVEKVVSDTEVITSESGWGCAKPFWNQTRKKGANSLWGAGAGYKFLGFIYNPAVTDDVAPSSAKPAAITPGYVSTGSAADEKTIWSYLFSKLGNEFGVAGLMGNLYAESGLRSNNLQNSYEKSLGFTDASYTAAVDNGTYTNFVRDSAGYGLWQLTYWTRKEDYLKYARSKGRSIGDLETQLEYLLIELGQYGLVDTLKNAKSVREASNVILLKFEKPASMNDPATQTRRANYGQKYYDAYAAGGSKPVATAPATTKPASVKVDYAQKFDKSLAGAYKVTAAGGLNIRAGCSTSKVSLGVLPCGTIVRNYGYYSVAANGVKWLYLKTDTGVIGFSSSNFLERC